MRMMQDIASTYLGGYLLVALPTLLDPNFRRTILLLTHHDKEGAMGFIMNRPCLKGLGELLSAPDALSKTPVFDGGPVEKNTLILAGLLWKESGVRFQSLDEDDLAREETFEIYSKDSILAFTGYAGWTGGQLEQEIAEKSWHLLSPSPQMLLPVKTPEEGIQRWKEIMKGLGPWHNLLAQAPDDPGVN
jgi:putative transcriptional regulator